jgi:cytochrome c-type biogenesis protein CcmH/NrfF
MNNEIIGLMIFFFAIFCGMWAQKTSRNYVLWFFAGLFFAPITGIVLLVKNRNRYPKD